ncbi:hypothetical protein GCM10022291_06640 [Postechiella marina]|uniref:Uncharacterized protein n=1 Tax=Postechiella marina TaxID=943941 RepID=A0ABP8C1Y9_9FLAO
MNIIKSFFIRIIISLAIAQGIAKEFPKYEDILLISLTILLLAFLSYLANKF